MKYIGLVLILLACSAAFGQSAKKRNKQLLAQFALEQQKQDSAYAVFVKSDRKSDSIRAVLNKKISSLTDAERAANRAYSDATARENQLVALGVDPNVVVSYDSKIDRIPKYMNEIRSVKETIRAEVKFKKVSDNLQLDGFKRREQNALLFEKVKEYQGHSQSNRIKQQELDAKNVKLVSHASTVDSLSAVYKIYEDALILKNRKLQQKLDELRANYAQKGPKGFPEAYGTVFWDVFPVTEDRSNKMVQEFVAAFDRSMMVEAPMVDKMPVPEEILKVVDEYAAFPGGPAAMKAYIAKNLLYPETMKEDGVSGKVYVRFVVSETGSISDVTLMRGISGCKECDLEVIRMVKGMPNWIPGKNKGKEVKSYFMLPVLFQAE